MEPVLKIVPHVLPGTAPIAKVTSKSRKKAIRGRLLRDHPIFSEVFPEDNPGIDLNVMAWGSHKKLNFRCPVAKCDHHRYPAMVKSRTGVNASGCPFCVGKQTCRCDSLAMKRPDLMKEWSPNNTVDPFTISLGSSYDAEWICSILPQCGHHVWRTMVSARAGTKGSGCPFHSHHKTCICDSVATLNPALCRELLPGQDLDLTTIPPCSTKDVWWFCLEASCNHHVWKATFANRTFGTGCPFHAKQKVCPCDSLEGKFPKIAAELDPINGVDAKTISPCSHKTYWWICLIPECKFQWPAVVGNRTMGRRGCPRCSSSHLEKEFTAILKELDIPHDRQKRFLECHDIRTLPFDFYLTTYNALVELDGIQHFISHYYRGGEEGFIDRKKKDQIKTTFTRTAGINLLRISYSEIDSLKAHLLTFLDQITKNPTTRVEMFIGDEYKAPSEAPTIPNPIPPTLRLVQVQPVVPNDPPVPTLRLVLVPAPISP